MADYVSVLTGGSNNYATTAENLNALATDILNEGVVGTIGNTSGVAPMTGGLAVNAQGTPDMTVAVTAGKCYVTTTPTSQSSQLLRANIATQNATIASNSTGGTRYDWIYVAMSASGAANPAADGTGVASITVSRSTSSATDNGTPPTYGYPIAVVTVSNGAATITNGNITDLRTALAVSNNTSNDGWITAEATPNTVTANGNRSYDLVFNSIDLTDTLSLGMRLKSTRTTSAPTQCTSLNGSTQYYNKTSPNKLTFTDDFVVSAWVKLSSINTATVAIASRFNGTSGWALRLLSGGQVELIGFNGGSGNHSYVSSTNTVAVGRWVHIAAQLDMSTFTATATTSYVMLDGVNAPASVTRAGTNPTALVQAGNLEIGSENGGTLNFPGKIAQVAIYNAKVTQATLLASMNQTLTGSETSLASAYSFNNSIADLNTTTPNDLTAQGSAVATNADSPFTQKVDGTVSGTTDYAIITKTAFSTNSTITVQVPEGNTLPTSGGISALSYSDHKTPYGFISDKNKWIVETQCSMLIATSIGSVITLYAATPALVVPVGAWTLGWTGTVYQSSTVAGLRDPCWVMATSSITYATRSTPLTTRGYLNAGSSLSLVNGYKTSSLVNTSTQTYNLYCGIGAATGTETWSIAGSDSGPLRMFAELAYV